MSAFWGPWSYAYKHWLHRGCAERAGGATGEGLPALVRETSGNLAGALGPPLSSGPQTFVCLMITWRASPD